MTLNFKLDLSSSILFNIISCYCFIIIYIRVNTTLFPSVALLFSIQSTFSVAVACTHEFKIFNFDNWQCAVHEVDEVRAKAIRLVLFSFGT